MNENENKPEAELEEHSQTEDNLQYDRQVDEIIEFYKDIPEADETDSDNNKEKKSFPKMLRSISAKLFGKEKDYSVPESDNEDLHESAYGLSKKNRTIVTYIITFFICAAVIGGSYGLALILPGNEEETEKYAETLRDDEAYRELKQEHDQVITETNALRDSVTAKQEQADNIENIDNTKSELHAAISEKAQELEALNAERDRLTLAIAEVDAAIAANSGAVTKSLPPGRYTVGSDIAPGKYTVMGSGAFSVANTSGESIYNTNLGANPLEVELSAGYKLKLGGTVRFTPAI